MATRVFSRSKITTLASIVLQNLTKTPSKDFSFLAVRPKTPLLDNYFTVPKSLGLRQYHDGRPRGALWRGKKLIGKEALFVIMGLKRLKDDEEKLQTFIKTHALRLLKMDMVAVLIELERQEETILAVKVLVSFLHFYMLNWVPHWCLVSQLFDKMPHKEILSFDQLL